MITLFSIALYSHKKKKKRENIQLCIYTQLYKAYK